MSNDETANNPPVLSPHGMTLRDWFAGQALIGLMSNAAGTKHTYEELTVFAYRTADAMLAQRANHPNQGD